MSQPDKHLEDDAEFPDFSDLIANLRSASQVEPEEPPAAVWEGIRGAVRASSSEGSVGDLGQARAKRAARNHQIRRAAVMIAAVAALLLVAVPVGLSLRGDGDDVQLAAAELLVLTEAAEAPGEATLVSDDDDLALNVEALATTEGSDFLELWLLRVDTDGGIVELVSLGEMEGPGRYDVPDDIDLDASWLVDISVEVDDGDETHGGNSVLRGDLA